MSKITNEVLLEKIENLINTNDEQHTAILKQTTLTNSRVGKLESLKDKIVGGLIISNVICIPLAIYFITKYF